MILAYSDDRFAMSERLAEEHFSSAIDEPELELKVREKEPQTLDAALKYAQRLEVFKNAVCQRRQRYTRKVAESPASRSSSVEDRLAKLERDFQKSQQQQDESHKQSHQENNVTDSSNKREKRERRSDDKRSCAVSVSTDEEWKRELMKKMQDLELTQQEITAENSALKKEVERLRYLEQLRSVPAPATAPAQPASTSAVRPLMQSFPNNQQQQRLLQVRTAGSLCSILSSTFCHGCSRDSFPWR